MSSETNPTQSVDSIVSYSEVLAASDRIKSHIHRTPVVTCHAIDERARCQLFFKCEHLQKSGSFKIRGAINAVAQLTDLQKANGVVTHSSGNHAAALSLAAKIFGTAAHIVMPSNSSEIKKAAVRSYGGKIVECEPNLAARETTAEVVRQETGAVLIPPFDHSHIIAGQATCAKELFEQIPDLDVVVAPIGGGGLMSGTCLSAKAQSNQIKIIGTEPIGADDAFQSKKNNRFVPQTNPQTIADGLRTSLGKLTWPFVRDDVDQVICVSEDSIVATMKFFWERSKQIIEPSSAVPLAAVLSKEFTAQFLGAKVGLILSGGNVDLQNLPW